ncbi:hypothetical protein ACFL4G_04110 [Thermodesulfobacteriota bacterium]
MEEKKYPELDKEQNEKMTYEKPDMEEHKPLDEAAAYIYYYTIL